MILINLIVLFLLIRSSTSQPDGFKPLLNPKDCVCSDIAPNQMRIFNGTKLNERDAPYVVLIYYRYKAFIKSLLYFFLKIFYR